MGEICAVVMDQSDQLPLPPMTLSLSTQHSRYTETSEAVMNAVAIDIE